MWILAYKRPEKAEDVKEIKKPIVIHKTEDRLTIDCYA